MTIGKKVGAGFALAGALVLVICWTAHRNTEAMLEDTRRLTHTHSVLEQLAKVVLLLTDAEASVRGFVMGGNEGYLEPYHGAEVALGPALDEFARQAADNPVQQSRVPELRRSVSARVEALRELVAARQLGVQPAVDLLELGAGKRAMDEVRAIERDLRAEEERLLRSGNQRSEETARRSLATLQWGCLAALLMLTMAALLITRSITGPLQVLLEGATEIERGTLAHRIKTKTTGELERLASTFNGMAESLSLTLVSAETEKQARARIEHLLQTIAEAAQSLVSATAAILAGTSQQAVGAQEQAAAVTQTIATVDEVVHTSEQSADRARAVAAIAQRSLEIGKAGRRSVEDCVDVMETVKDQVESSAESILALAERAQAIGDIMATVNDIAEQTNLLALNAAIEASHAGDHGRGFAVVAAEVKALSDQSKKATGQVRQILGEIKKATRGAVAAAEDCTGSVASAMKVVVQAGDTIRSLLEIISEAAQAASQIAASASQQALGTEQIHHAMKNINQVTHQNLSSVRQMEHAARDLTALGAHLRERLSHVERRAVG